VPIPPVLARIVAVKEEETAELLAATPLAALEQAAARRLAADPPRAFAAALAIPDPAGVPRVIAEIKRASPSKGVIRADFDPPALAAAYASGGAAAISCLTDRRFFQGDLAFLRPVREACGLPVLRKDFLLHPAQILEAAAAGADAILLIARLLEPGRLAELHRLAVGLGLGVLTEIHDEADADAALAAGASLIGVNNRDLDTFAVDPETTYRLRRRIPAAVPMVAESGIGRHEELRRLAAAGIAAALVGESLMREPDVGLALLRLRTGGEERT